VHLRFSVLVSVGTIIGRVCPSVDCGDQPMTILVQYPKFAWPERRQFLDATFGAIEVFGRLKPQESALVYSPDDVIVP